MLYLNSSQYETHFILVRTATPLLSGHVRVAMPAIFDACFFQLSLLQDCLAEGRSVSLPASAVGASKLAVTAVGAYARIRKQFRVPIAEMGGVQVQLDTLCIQSTSLNLQLTSLHVL